MKLTTTNGTVTLQSENKKEALQLFAYALERQNQEVTINKTPTAKIYKERRKRKYTLTKRCQFCNRACRGGTGLSAHERACAKRPLFQPPEFVG